MQIMFWREVKERHLKVLLLCLFREHALGFLQNPCTTVVLTANLLTNLQSLQWILTLTFVLGTSRALPFLAVAWTKEHVFSMHLFLTKWWTWQGVFTMAKSNSHQNTRLNLQASGSHFPSALFWIVVYQFLKLYSVTSSAVPLEVRLNGVLCVTVWSHQMDVLQHKSEYACLWVIVCILHLDSFVL